MKKLLLVLLLVTPLVATALPRVAVSKADSNITYTITDAPCKAFANPDGAPLRAAEAFDAKKGVTIYGCALDYGKYIEFQLIDETQTKHFQLVVPAIDFKDKQYY